MKGIAYREFTKGDIAFMICSSCNTNCAHCYVAYEGNRDPNQLCDMIEQMRNRFQITLNGTEPLLNPAYLKAYQMAGQDYILTNDIILDQNPQLYDQLLDHGIRHIGISYHFQTHDLISSIPKELIRRVIAEAMKRDFFVSVNCTITPHSYDKVLENCAAAHEMGAKRIHFTNFISHGTHNIHKHTLSITQEQKYVFFRQLAEARSLYPKETLEVSRCGTFERDTYRHKDNFYCGIYEYGLAITPDDKVYPCIFMTGPGEEIGFVRNNRIFIREDLTHDCNQCLVYQKFCCYHYCDD